ncbi:dipeptidase [Carboxylicivirga linearis]|uniref:Dipeptidase n=1 Tax=Carboxylicivirga linearis TaxID=1628157 RepID=A0ABS5JS24_9BACT|nr:C69 family dipeptidase [Carboxylicivirga linearis]MBS2097374.1 C69 family dipeptidase [Carboxylicivirga linearis]
MKKLTALASALAIALIISLPGNACTNVLITKNASVDGSTMVSYAADSHDLYGELYYWPAATYETGSLLKVYEWDTGKYLGEIAQAKQTYTVIGNMNEHQVTIAETTFGGRSELHNPDGLIDYGSLIYIALQRSKSAREAIQIMTSLVEEYGYYSSGESFSIADKDEVWIMELIGKGQGYKGANWVAIQIPDGYVSAHANQSRITTFDYQKENRFDDPTANVFNSKDVIDFAKEKGYFDGKKKDFSFADAYAPLDFGAVRFCEARVWSAFNIMNPAEMGEYVEYAQGNSTNRMPLFIKPNRKISHRDVMNIMRDHYEDTPLDMTKDAGAGPYNIPYRFRPLTWEVDDATYFNERAIATQQTGFSFVAQMRNWLPSHIGGILWFGVDDAASTVYMPMYAGIVDVPYCLAQGNGDLLNFTWDSSFWVFTFVSNQAYGRYSYMIEDIKKVQKELEDNLTTYTVAIDQSAKALYDQNPELARQFLTDFCCNQAEIVTERWRQLGEFLMVKYNDGNLHEEENGEFKRNEHGNPAHAKFPGYSEEYYRNVVKDAGNKLKMRELPKDE